MRSARARAKTGRILSLQGDNSMAVSYFRDFPPYLGDEPYVYLCFHESDARAVLPLLDALTQRRCRVWYSMGSATNAAQHHERQG